MKIGNIKESEDEGSKEWNDWASLIVEQTGIEDETIEVKAEAR
jgi:hypothetical protein